MTITISNQSLPLPKTINYQLISADNTLSRKPIEKLREKIETDLADFLIGKKKVLIVVNDSTRNTKTDQILSLIRPLLHSVSLVILVATGTHPAPSKKQLKTIFKEQYEWVKPYLKIHDSKRDKMKFFGTTRFQNDVYYNQLIDDCDAIIAINSVEPHYFAGYTGGRKSFIPGIAVYRTIEKNHSLAMKDDAQICRLEGNPVHEDFTEAASFIKLPIFSIQFVQNQHNQLLDLFCGNLCDSFQQAVELAKKRFIIPMEQKFDCILAEVESPFNETFYQAHKALENAKSVLREGGDFILFADCFQGIGNSQFIEQLRALVAGKEEKRYSLGYHKAVRIYNFLQKNRLWLFSPANLDLFDHPHFRQLNDFQAVIHHCFSHRSLLHIKDAATTVPIITN